jgi:hypothetical protein
MTATDLLGTALPVTPFGLPDNDPAVRWCVLLLGFDDDQLPLSLPGWAGYLAGDWGGYERTALAVPGQVFRAVVFALRYAEALTAGAGFVLPACPPQCEFLAVVDAPRQGWFEEDMVSSADEALDLLRDRLGGWVVFRETIEHRCGVRFDIVDGKPVCTIVPDPGLMQPGVV